MLADKNVETLKNFFKYKCLALVKKQFRSIQVHKNQNAIFVLSFYEPFLQTG